MFLVDYLVCFFGDCSENGKSEGSGAIQDTQNDNNLVEQNSEAPDRYLIKIIVLISLNMIVVFMIMIMRRMMRYHRCISVAIVFKVTRRAKE